MFSLWSWALRVQHGAGLKMASPQKETGKWLCHWWNFWGCEVLLSLYAPPSLLGNFSYTQNWAKDLRQTEIQEEALLQTASHKEWQQLLYAPFFPAPNMWSWGLLLQCTLTRLLVLQIFIQVQLTNINLIFKTNSFRIIYITNNP